MKNKHFILGILLLVILPPALYPQSATERKGVKNYELYSYQEAANRLEQISSKSTEVLRMLADSYFKIGKTEKAQMAYADLMQRTDRTPDDVYQYAYVLSVNKKYTEAARWMETYANLVPHDSRVERYFANPRFYEELMKDRGQFELNHLEFNNDQSDFGTSFWNDMVVFASTRALSRPFRRLWSWNKLPFLNLFIAHVDEDGQFYDIQNFGKDLNNKYHDGPAAFARDGTFMAFTRNNYDSASSDDVIKLALFTAKLQDDRWSEPVAFPYNSHEYSIGHAALTPDGRTIFFASDMPGGYGGVDIYVSQGDASGQWSEPQNLGPSINTEGDEMFPFIHPEGWLFFSSDGLPGLGALDVFYSNVSDINNPTNPVNPGVPVNSSGDDFAFILNNEMERGYFSSNRASGSGSDDIYAFSMNFSIRKIIRGTTRDRNNNILSQVQVQLLNENDSVLQTSYSSENGTFEFYVDKNVKYRLAGMLDNYTPGYVGIDDMTGQVEIVADLELQRLPEYSLYGVISDSKTGEPLDGVRVRLENNKTQRIEDFLTSREGDFQHKLTGVLQNDSISFTITIQKHGYVNRTFTYEHVVDQEGPIDVHEELDMTMVKIEVGADLGKLLGLNPVEFDDDDAEILPDAAKELDKIVEVMNQYPEMEIELGAHTDCRGSAAYNLRLSIHRAEQATWYIQSYISNPSRIYKRGYGEIRPVNNCVCEGSRSRPCTEEEHRQNRRVEFQILRVE